MIANFHIARQIGCCQIIKNDILVIFNLPADGISVVQLPRHFPDLQTSYEMISYFSTFVKEKIFGTT